MGGHGIISGGETLPHEHRRGHTSRCGTGRGGTRGSTESVSVENQGRGCLGSGVSSRGGRSGQGCGYGIDISTSPFGNSLGTWEKTICISTCLQAYLRSKHSTAQ